MSAIALTSPPSDDICYATQNRQTAVKQIAAEAGLVIVVGPRNSSNSPAPHPGCQARGAHNAHLVDDASEIDEVWLPGVTTVGVTTGASVPDVVVEAVLEYPAQRDYADVEIVKAVEESITFSLPKELRRDLRTGSDTKFVAPIHDEALQQADDTRPVGNTSTASCTSWTKGFPWARHSPPACLRSQGDEQASLRVGRPIQGG